MHSVLAHGEVGQGGLGNRALTSLPLPLILPIYIHFVPFSTSTVSSPSLPPSLNPHLLTNHLLLFHLPTEFTPEQQEYKELAAKFTREEVIPKASYYDRTGEVSQYLCVCVCGVGGKQTDGGGKRGKRKKWGRKGKNRGKGGEKRKKKALMLNMPQW